MARSKTYTIGNEEQLQVTYTDGEQDSNPLLMTILLLADELTTEDMPTEVNGIATGWGLLLELSKLTPEELSLPCIAEDKAPIIGKLEIGCVYGTEYIKIL